MKRTARIASRIDRRRTKQPILLSKLPPSERREIVEEASSILAFAACHRGNNQNKRVRRFLATALRRLKRLFPKGL